MKILKLAILSCAFVAANDIGAVEKVETDKLIHEFLLSRDEAMAGRVHVGLALTISGYQFTSTKACKEIGTASAVAKSMDGQIQVTLDHIDENSPVRKLLGDYSSILDDFVEGLKDFCVEDFKKEELDALAEVYRSFKRGFSELVRSDKETMLSLFPNQSMFHKGN